MTSATLVIDVQTVGPLQENCYILSDVAADSAVIVDPGYEGERLLRAIDRTGCTLRAIWLTHGHIDHVGAVQVVAARHDVPIYLHPADRPFYDEAHTLGAMYGMVVAPLPSSVQALVVGERLIVGESAFEIQHYPGHSPGSVAFVSGELCFSGDVLFEGSIGRTDLPLSDPRAMHASLQRIATLTPSTRVFPGHGDETSIARELASNPFLRGVARPVGA